MPAVIDDGYKLVLKVHTKKSGHLKTGVLWRNDLYQKLLGEKPMMSIVNLFKVASDVGMVGPVDHVLPMHLFYGSNAATILAICRALTIPPDVLPGRTFIAGSMFYARINVIIPILNLGLQPTDFEPELGQVDGTLAHALERIFALSSIASGLQVVDSSWRPDSAGVSSTVRHKFIR
jgi:lipopolysaccharide biosynthesis protein